MARPSRSVVLSLSVGVLVGSLATASALFAEGRREAATPAAAAAELVTAPFDIVDTAGSTYLLNRSTGQVWRLSFTEVQGNKYWYGMHVPTQQPGSFEDFQARIRREIASPK
jgi:hypothetical protein